MILGSRLKRLIFISDRYASFGRVRELSVDHRSIDKTVLRVERLAFLKGYFFFKQREIQFVTYDRWLICFWTQKKYLLAIFFSLYDAPNFLRILIFSLKFHRFNKKRRWFLVWTWVMKINSTRRKCSVLKFVLKMYLNHILYQFVK